MTRYRTGRSLGRTVYRIELNDPGSQDELIGMMDTPELGTLVVEALNAYERAGQGTSAQSPGKDPPTCVRVGLHNCGGTWLNHDRANDLPEPS